MNTPILIRYLCVAVGACVSVRTVLADEPPVDQTKAVSPAAVPTEPSPDARRFLLLTNDRVLSGTIIEQPDGYIFKRKGASMLVPKKDVARLGGSLLEIYEFKRSQVPHNDAQEHWKICQWCFAQGLLEQCEREAEHVLSIDPGNVHAARRLRALRQPAVETSEQVEPKAVSTPIPAPDSSNIIGTFVRGHGQRTFELFTTIERRLVNHCGDCHSSRRYHGVFRLYRRNPGESSEQRDTANNLQSVLRTIDLQQPDRSPLLHMALTAHGPARLPSYGGPNDPAYRELLDFVSRVYEGRKMEIIADASPGKHGIISGPVTRSQTNSNRKSPTRIGDQPGDDMPSPARSSSAADDAPESPIGVHGPQDGTAVRTARKPSNRKNGDPYDPDEFNKQFGSVRRKRPENDSSGEADTKNGKSNAHTDSLEDLKEVVPHVDRKAAKTRRFPFLTGNPFRAKK